MRQQKIKIHTLVVYIITVDKHLFLEFIVERTDFDEPVRQYVHDVPHVNLLRVDDFIV